MWITLFSVMTRILRFARPAGPAPSVGTSCRGAEWAEIGRRAPPLFAHGTGGAVGAHLLRIAVEVRVLALIVSGQMVGQLHRGYPNELCVCESHRCPGKNGA